MKTLHIHNCLSLTVEPIERRIRVKKCVIVGANMQDSSLLYVTLFEIFTALSEISSQAHYPYCWQLRRALDLPLTGVVVIICHLHACPSAHLHSPIRYFRFIPDAVSVYVHII
jgi:hypothetical protein